LLTYLLKKSSTAKLQQEIYKDQPLCCKITNPGNTFLQIAPNILYSLSYGLNFYFFKDENSKRRASGMALATIYSGLITDSFKHIFYEQRPNGGGNSSFPSGHATSAFAFASFVASEHPWYAGTLAYMLASYVGFCRLQDNHHYIHDVLAGATIGMSYGISMSQNSKQNLDSKSATVIAPTDDLSGVSVKYSFHF